jgi:hypothetical protein
MIETAIALTTAGALLLLAGLAIGAIVTTKLLGLGLAELGLEDLKDVERLRAENHLADEALGDLYDTLAQIEDELADGGYYNPKAGEKALAHARPGMQSAEQTREAVHQAGGPAAYLKDGGHP